MSGAQRVYDDQFLAALYLSLTVNEGNVSRTAKEMSLPETTVRNYKKRWAETGPPGPVQEQALILSGQFEQDAEVVRDLALNALKNQIMAGKASASSLIAAVGMLTDKIRLAQGLATTRSETVHSVDPAAIAASVTSLVRDALTATDIRDGEIIDAEIVEEPAPRALSAAS